MRRICKRAVGQRDRNMHRLRIAGSKQLRPWVGTIGQCGSGTMVQRASGTLGQRANGALRRWDSAVGQWGSEAMRQRGCCGAEG
jgi:hypothetical protein